MRNAEALRVGTCACCPCWPLLLSLPPNIYNGLWYAIRVAAMTTLIGALLLRDTKDVDINVGSGVEAVRP